ncbi:hypothetical protein HMY34_14615 [Thiothrix subterranea]|uniref:beta strand repeat-containing protein n=1 Tax=Thiothrix subterranea TaxID=2735563 RepID=UPI00192B9887|nr:Calx-beta domain-containing protein [Thiothrix subterranea]QQZ29893.1 hypothetical protein HMY34_14615 [Thiothrix subterranea]
MARILLSQNDKFNIATDNSDVVGAAGAETVVIFDNAPFSVDTVKLDQNVERAELALAQSGYQFQATGNVLSVIGADGKVIMTLPVNTSGVQTVAMQDGSAVVKFETAGVNAGKITVGGVAVSTTASTLSGVTLNGTDGSSHGPTGGASTFSMTAASSIAEGNSGTTTLTVTIARSGDTTEAASVTLKTANGTATAGSDYTAVDQVVTFAVGESSKTVNVLVSGDTAFEGNETFSISLSNPSAGDVINAAAAAATITITNDDALSITLNPAWGVTTADQFVGNFDNFGAAQFALLKTENSAVFERNFDGQGNGRLWVDKNKDGILNVNDDEQIIVPGTSNVTAAQLNLIAGNTITLTAPSALVNATKNDNATDKTTVANDTINTTVANLVGSTIDGLAKTDTLVITDKVTSLNTPAPGGLALGDTKAGGTLTSIDAVTLAAGTDANAPVAIHNGTVKVTLGAASSITLGAPLTGTTGDTVVGSAEADVIKGDFADAVAPATPPAVGLQANYQYDETINGGAGNDTINVAGGKDKIDGGDGNDSVEFDNTFLPVGVKALTSDDTVNGGAGSLDFLNLFGNVNAVADDFKNVSGFEGLVLDFLASDATVIVGDALVAAGTTFGVSALQPSTATTHPAPVNTANKNVSFDGSAEKDGAFSYTSSDQVDNVKGGEGNDTFKFDTFLTNADTVAGGKGTDTLEIKDGTAANTDLALVSSIEVLKLADVNTTLAATDALVDKDGTLTIDVSTWKPTTTTPVYTASTLNFDGSLELDGKFNITGGAGNDIIIGGSKDDIIVGGAGDDTLTGGAGKDTLTGGAGKDNFAMTAAQSNIQDGWDKISDLNVNDDKIKVGGNAPEPGVDSMTLINVASATSTTLASAIQSQVAMLAQSAYNAIGDVLFIEVANFNGAAATFLAVNGNNSRTGLSAIDASDVFVEITGVTGSFSIDDIIA